MTPTDAGKMTDEILERQQKRQAAYQGITHITAWAELYAEELLEDCATLISAMQEPTPPRKPVDREAIITLIKLSRKPVRWTPEELADALLPMLEGR